jgi:hypothetical protein
VSKLIEPVWVEIWSTDEIYEAAGSLVCEQLSLDLGQFVERYLAGEFDTCDFIEIVSLLSLLPEDDKYYIGSTRKDAA